MFFKAYKDKEKKACVYFDLATLPSNEVALIVRDENGFKLQTLCYLNQFGIQRLPLDANFIKDCGFEVTKNKCIRIDNFGDR